MKFLSMMSTTTGEFFSGGCIVDTLNFKAALPFVPVRCTYMYLLVMFLSLPS